MPDFAKKVLRLTFSVASTVSPRGAGKLAFRVFSLAPSRFPKGERARSVFAEGAGRLSRAEPRTISTPHGKVMTYRLAPPNAAAGPSGGGRHLVVHGWGSRSEYMAALAEGVAKATGGEVILLDFPGHGASGGRFLDMRLAVEAITEVDRTFGPFDGAVGHSFGGASLMVAACRFLPQFPAFTPGRMALIGAPSEMDGIFRYFSQKVGLPARAQPHLEKEVRRITGRRSGDFDIARAGQDLDLPVLVVHAEDDKEVSADHARRYAALGENVQLGWANGYGHRRIVAAPPVIDLVSSFLRRDGAAEIAEAG
ncbi:alpha/beta hydrolase [Rhizobiaceae bacterium BDR2-2]|uniref:Alpha/beta hydrolase n=1 Tax=Ectorhizobium quercum TaxID=2965071 RepID=A0AAE3SWV8_9HYPH|nr:alpha/beta hydrolase [Ectorhizobium quercum]MCX8999830.1 alpha/beta hydrolase [Ectorhizobium quercum]